MRKRKIDILIVDDSVHDAELTMRALSRHAPGHEYLHLKDGEQALNFLFRRPPFEERPASALPRLILLDMKMPRVDGLEVLGAIRTDDDTRCIPVVLFTSSKESRDLRSAYEAGTNSYIVKPSDFSDFTEAIGQVSDYWLRLNTAPD